MPASYKFTSQFPYLKKKEYEDEEKPSQRVIIPRGMVNPRQTTIIEIPPGLENMSTVVAHKSHPGRPLSPTRKQYLQKTAQEYAQQYVKSHPQERPPQYSQGPQQQYAQGPPQVSPQQYGLGTSQERPPQYSQSPPHERPQQYSQGPPQERLPQYPQGAPQERSQQYSKSPPQERPPQYSKGSSQEYYSKGPITEAQAQMAKSFNRSVQERSPNEGSAKERTTKIEGSYEVDPKCYLRNYAKRRSISPEKPEKAAYYNPKYTDQELRAVAQRHPPYTEEQHRSRSKTKRSIEIPAKVNYQPPMSASQPVSLGKSLRIQRVLDRLDQIELKGLEEDLKNFQTARRKLIFDVSSMKMF